MTHMKSRKHAFTQCVRVSKVRVSVYSSPVSHCMSVHQLLTFPESVLMASSIRAKALLFQNSQSIELRDGSAFSHPKAFAK